MSFTQDLLGWYREKARDLPWRNSPDAYKIWLSEIILQQTRIAQGTPYYHKFIVAYPDIHKLAHASEDEVLKLWQGLGYYSRARNLMKCASIISKEYKGQFPADHDKLLKLPGIGPYTAAAIASLAFRIPKAAIDGNVIRVLSRINNIDVAVDSKEGKKAIVEAANHYLDRQDPGEYNQAMMDLGSTVCQPHKPLCDDCPVNKYCMALAKGTHTKLPFKSIKTKTRKRYFHYLDIDFKGKTYLNKRPQGDIWTGLYDFPLIETPKEMVFDELSELKEWQDIFKDATIHIKAESREYKHVLSHQIIYARFYKLETHTEPGLHDAILLMEPSSIDSYPLPRLMDRYLNLEEDSIK